LLRKPSNVIEGNSSEEDDSSAENKVPSMKRINSELKVVKDATSANNMAMSANVERIQAAIDRHSKMKTSKKHILKQWNGPTNLDYDSCISDNASFPEIERNSSSSSNVRRKSFAHP